MYVLLVENLNPICKEEIKKEIDETVNSEKHMPPQQMTSLIQMNLQIKNNLEEVEQYSRRLSLKVDWVPVKEKEARMFLNMLWVFWKKQVLGRLMDILIEPIELVKLTLIKSIQKNLTALSSNLQHSALHNSLPVNAKYES